MSIDHDGCNPPNITGGRGGYHLGTPTHGRHRCSQRMLVLRCDTAKGRALAQVVKKQRGSLNGG